jgi:hypothetical protein
MINVNDIVVGSEVRYRVAAGRGRPANGKVLAKRGLFCEIENLLSGVVSLVKRDKITASYEFKPYVYDKGKLPGRPKKVVTVAANDEVDYSDIVFA